MMETQIEFGIKPIAELTSVLRDYVYSGQIALSPSQDQVIDALLKQIEGLCTECINDN